MVLKELYNIQDTAKRLEFIKANKAEIIKAKRGIMKRADSVIAAAQPFKAEQANKAEPMEDGQFRIIGNSIGFMDSHMDVSMPGSFTKSVNERGNRIPILINHDYSPKSIFAANKGVAVEMVNIRQLGYNADGMTEAVVARIEPKYDAQMAALYEDGQIKEHSVGIRYVKLELAMNDDTENREFENWQKYIGQVINREMAEEAGFFFAVTEQRLEEISAVVFGSNPYTPTLNDKDQHYQDKATQNEPQNGTRKEPEGQGGALPDLVELFNNA